MEHPTLAAFCGGDGKKLIPVSGSTTVYHDAEKE
jgi:hypothetical protein